MRINTDIFKAYDVRGIYPGEIDEDIDRGFNVEKKGVRNTASGKTHHFAVKTRDERIDWMRELMLAKALKQKNEGYEINVNGNMI